jgi:hypothetical protein
MVVGLTALMIMVMKLFPDLSSTKWLHRLLVERPVDWLASAQRHHIIFAVLMTVFVIALPFAPETLAVLQLADLSLVTFVLDISIYIDIIAVIALAGAVKHAVESWRGLRLLATSRQRPLMRARRRSRAARSRPRRQPANDDERISWRVAA